MLHPRLEPGVDDAPTIRATPGAASPPAGHADRPTPAPVAAPAGREKPDRLAVSERSGPLRADHAAYARAAAAQLLSLEDRVLALADQQLARLVRIRGALLHGALLSAEAGQRLRQSDELLLTGRDLLCRDGAAVARPPSPGRPR